MKRIKVSKARDRLVSEEHWCKNWINLRVSVLPPVPDNMIKDNPEIHQHIIVRSYMQGLRIGIAVLTDLLTGDNNEKKKESDARVQEVQLIFDDILESYQNDNG